MSKDKKQFSKITKRDLEDLPLPAIIRAFNDELVNTVAEEERAVSWEEDDDDGTDGGGHLVRLDKELHMARLILLEKTKSGEDTRLDSKFLIALVKLLSKSEKAVGWYGTKMKLWRRFLSIVVEKMKQEPISVYDKKSGKEKRIAMAQFENELRWD